MSDTWPIHHGQREGRGRDASHLFVRKAIIDSAHRLLGSVQAVKGVSVLTPSTRIRGGPSGLVVTMWMPKATDDAALWLRQAADDYKFGQSALTGRFYAQACFIAQQVGEKAVKAVHYRLARRPVIGHSIHALMKRLNARAGVTEELLELAGELDQFYVSARYPDALPGIAPADAFSREQARSALRSVGKILRWARSQVKKR